jgi:hypothetical protein
MRLFSFIFVYYTNKDKKYGQLDPVMEVVFHCGFPGIL